MWSILQKAKTRNIKIQNSKFKSTFVKYKRQNIFLLIPFSRNICNINVNVISSIWRFCPFANVSLTTGFGSFWRQLPLGSVIALYPDLSQSSSCKFPTFQLHFYDLGMWLVLSIFGVYSRLVVNGWHTNLTKIDVICIQPRILLRWTLAYVNTHYVKSANFWGGCVLATEVAVFIFFFPPECLQCVSYGEFSILVYF